MSRSPVRAALLAALTACTVYKTPAVSEVPHPSASDSVAVASPVKAHLLDGSTVVYWKGVLIVRDTVRALPNTAYRYGLTLVDSAPADALPLDSVLAMESFKNSVNRGASAALTVLGVAGGVLAGAALIVAISCIGNPKCFGSCPTAYDDSAGVARLEAETFSYSIAPLFEARDVDRLRAQADAAGDLRLEIRNEALETHYINQLGLLEVRHAADELVVPDATGRPLAVRDFVSPRQARSRAGRDVRPEVLAADGATFRTDPETIERADAADPDDFIDLVFAAPPGVDTVALVFRMRNSLLNTVLFYEMMLADPGARALDWIGRELDEIGPATRLGRWYAGRMGMRVAVRDGADLRVVGRIPDTGPVAWKDVAVRVPVPPGDSLRVRLEFVADDWRIDQIRLALGARLPAFRSLSPTKVLDGGRVPDSAAVTSLGAADQRYLVTGPGQRFDVHFAVGPQPPDSARTFLLVSQGYYVEWLRRSWLEAGHEAATFQPSDDVLVRALRRWHVEQVDFERRFAATRVPVR